MNDPGLSSTAVRTRALTRRYGTRLAVDSLTLEIPRGELFVFLGPNGAGKTTTIRMLTCQLTPTSGRAEILGMPIDGDALRIKRRIGYLPEEPVLYERLTGREFLQFIADIHGLDRSAAHRRMNDLLDRLAMSRDADLLVESYSLGMRKKIALVSTLLHEPDILFWDEPTGSLDPRSARALKDLMREQCDRGGVVFMTTHVLEIAERLADRIGIISNGRLVAAGAPGELRRSGQNLEDVFLEVTAEAPHEDPANASGKPGEETP